MEAPGTEWPPVKRSTTDLNSPGVVCNSVVETGRFLILTESLLILRGDGGGPRSWTSFLGGGGGGFIVLERKKRRVAKLVTKFNEVHRTHKDKKIIYSTA